MIKQSVPFLACLALLAGCVNFQYVGETESPSGNEVSVYTDATRIGRSYRVLGQATRLGRLPRRQPATGLLAKLKSEAESKGADAILITEQQVVSKSESRSVEPRFNTAYDYDGETSNWRQIQRDVDLNYGQIRGSLEEVRTNASYIRILRAEFLKYSGGEPEKLEVVEPEK